MLAKRGIGVDKISVDLNVDKLGENERTSPLTQSRVPAIGMVFFGLLKSLGFICRCRLLNLSPFKIYFALRLPQYGLHHPTDPSIEASPKL